MKRSITSWATVLALAAASPTVASAHDPSSGEVVRDWNDTARSQPFGNPLRLARILAIMHAAQHDAVNGARPRYETYASTLRTPGADPVAAAAAAAHEVLVAFFPANQAAVDNRLAESLAAVPDGHAEDAGVALGRATADIVLQARADDGYDTTDPFTPTPAPGSWEPTPPAFAPMLEPQFQNVTPFTLRDRTQFLPDPPPSLTSRAYTRAYDEVKRVGQDTSPVRTPDQTHIAHFWAEPSPSGWSRVANLVSARYRCEVEEQPKPPGRRGRGRRRVGRQHVGQHGDSCRRHSRISAPTRCAPRSRRAPASEARVNGLRVVPTGAAHRGFILRCRLGRVTGAQRRRQ